MAPGGCGAPLAHKSHDVPGAEEGDADVEPFADHIIRVPATPTILWPLLTVVPLQVFAAALAGAKGLDIDQPRNLAKSVTVE